MQSIHPNIVFYHSTRILQTHPVENRNREFKIENEVSFESEEILKDVPPGAKFVVELLAPPKDIIIDTLDPFRDC